MSKRFAQVKRYGLEGGETMMVAFDAILHTTASEEVVVAMPHRGRLNLMLGLLAYPAHALFHKLQGNSELAPGASGSGDVLSHLCTGRDLPSPHSTCGPHKRARHTCPDHSPPQLVPPRVRQRCGAGCDLWAAEAPQKARIVRADPRRRCLLRTGNHHGDAAADATARL